MTRTVLALFLISLVVACSDSPSTATQTSPPDRVQIEATLASAPPTAQAAAASPDLEPALPRADLFDLARRYRGLDLPSQVITQPPVASAGAVRSFFVVDLEANRAQEVRATLLAQTEHADIWVQDGQRFGRADAQRSGEIFETEVYPQVTRAFGLPAVAPDGSAGRIAILHTSLRGAGGYFAGSDQFPRTLVPFSNEQQILYLDSSIARPGDRAYAGLLAHEFQHLVHQQHNPNADTWINEGLSEVADEMLGGSNSFLRRFETLPDTQLDDWPAEGNSAAHYGAAHSFLRYLLRRYGGLEGAQRLVRGRRLVA